MDVLEKYKESWKNQPEETVKISKVDIYKMAHKKSSSIVKWIFIIGVLEFVFITIAHFIYKLNTTFNDAYSKMKIIFIASEIVSYIIISYFLFKFYKNYKSISTSDNTKTLMSKIIKTRKTVRNYILTVIVTSTLFIIPTLVYTLQTEEFKYTNNNFYMVLIVTFIVAMIFILFFYWIYYQLLYGFLLRKLNKNYKELANLDRLN